MSEEYLSGNKEKELQREIDQLRNTSKRLQREIDDLKTKSKRMQKVIDTEIEPKRKTIPITTVYLLLHFGMGMILIAGLVFFFIQWKYSPMTGTILPIIVYFCAGYFLRNFYARWSASFILTASALFPLFLLGLCQKFALFSSNPWPFISLVSLLLSLILLFLVKIPSGTLPPICAGIALYYFLVAKLISMTWLLFLVLAIIYYAVGIRYEKHNQANHAKYFYSAGGLVLFISLLLWGREGSFLSLLIEGDVTWPSLVLISLIFLAAASGLERATKSKLNILSENAWFFYVAGTFLFLGALFAMAVQFQTILPQIMLPIGCLFFIIASVYKQSKIFQSGGLFFLIFYLVYIGILHFPNKIGWPLTLLFLGMISAFIGWEIPHLLPDIKNNKTP